ncbi:hypothetical protein LTR75_018316, partial [Friedmanniomyces endolithicus]
MIEPKQPVVHKSKWQPNVSTETDHEDDGKDKSSLDASTDPHDVHMSERMDDDVQSNRSLDVKMRDASAASSTRSNQDQVDDISDALDGLVIVQDQ